MRYLNVVLFFTLHLGGSQSEAGKADTSQPDAQLPDADGWYSIFDGETLNGWKGNIEDTFTVRDGMIVVNGVKSHLAFKYC